MRLAQQPGQQRPDPNVLAALLLTRFGSKAATARMPKRERAVACTALRIGLLALEPQELAYPIALAVVERLARSNGSPRNESGGNTGAFPYNP